MRTKELADWLGVSASTIRYWTLGEFKAYLSPTAQGGEGRRRYFSDLDSRIIAYIASMRDEGAPNDDIHASLQRLQAGDWIDLPTMPAAPPGEGPVDMMPREAAETAVQTQRAALLREITLLQERVETLEDTLADERQQHSAQVSTLQGELLTARERLGQLSGRLEVIEGDRARVEQLWQGERQLWLRGTVVIGLVALALLTVVIILALANVR